MSLIISSAAYITEAAVYENALLLEGQTQNSRKMVYSDDIASTRSSTWSSQKLYLEEKNDITIWSVLVLCKIVVELFCKHNTVKSEAFLG
jgi:hypothetical protein